MNGIWVAKDGTKHIIVEMEDSHLHNATEMLKRRTAILKQKLEQLNNGISELQTERVRRLNAQAKAARERIIVRKMERKSAMQRIEGRRFR